MIDNNTELCYNKVIDYNVTSFYTTNSYYEQFNKSLYIVRNSMHLVHL